MAVLVFSATGLHLNNEEEEEEAAIVQFLSQE
jgi:hypothetical protein